MSQYVLIQSKSPWESGDIDHFYALARELRKDPGLDQLLGANVRVLADDFSLRERAIDAKALKNGVNPSAIDQVVDLLASGAKALWH